jgi:hypothetical protein
LRLDWRIALKAFAGFLVGLALWTMFSPLYNRAIAAGAERLMRSFEKPSVTRLRPDGNYVTVDRSDFARGSKRPGLPVHDLTFNFLLMTALFAAAKRPFSDRNVSGFAVSCVLMAATHIFALVAAVMNIYVLKLGPWSRVHYSDLERNSWSVVNHSYRLVVMYAIAFALWWIFRDNRDEAAKPARAAAAKKKRGR